MIESIHSNEDDDKKNKLKNIHMKLPKNIKQIGTIVGSPVVYMEDYVRTYLQQLAESDFAELSNAILVGAYQKSEEGQHLFIRGVIQTEPLLQGMTIVFSETVWGSIYDKMHQYFPEDEIVGWFCGGLNLPPCDMDIMKQVHVDNFPGKEKVLFFYDPLDKEECFYRFLNKNLEVQQGYYVYYDKNDAMQEYMLAYPLPEKSSKKRAEASNELEGDPVPEKNVENDKLFSWMKRASTNKEIEKKHLKKEGIISEEEKKKQEDGKRRTTFRLAYSALTMLVMVALVIAASITKEDTEVDPPMETASGNIFDLSENGKNKVTGEVKPTGENELDHKNPTDGSTPTWVTTAPAKVSEDGSITLIPTMEIVEPTKKPTKKLTPIPTPVPTVTPVPTKKPKNKETSKSTETSKYTVKQGDTLASISRKTYGNASYVKKISELNQLDDENIIVDGQEILLPKIKK